MIGGGVTGCAIAYHLARLGWTDVVLLERHELTEGTTWHSAGFVGQLRADVAQTRLIMYSAGLYPELRELTGLDPGWHGVGGLRLATTPQRLDELVRQAEAARAHGLESELLDPGDIRMPLIDVSDVLGALWVPGDGWLDPAALCRALAEGARRLGVRIHTGAEVSGIEVRGGRVHAVRLRDGSRIATGTVVNAAGAAAGVIGRLAGVELPIVPIRHQYVVTAPMDVPQDMPTIRDPDNILYFRESGGAFLVGGYSRTPQVWDDPDPLAAPRTLFAPDMAIFQESWEAARRRVPRLRGWGEAPTFRKVVHGPEAFTPDGDFLLGETEVGGLWVAAGFCVHGLAAAGGVGRATAEWITTGAPPFDIGPMHISRFAGGVPDARERALASYSRYYDVVPAVRQT